MDACRNLEHGEGACGCLAWLLVVDRMEQACYLRWVMTIIIIISNVVDVVDVVNVDVDVDVDDDVDDDVVVIAFVVFDVDDDVLMLMSSDYDYG